MKVQKVIVFVTETLGINLYFGLSWTAVTNLNTSL